MKTMIVRIGNSRGVRIPKPVLQQCGLEGEVDMEVRSRELVIRPVYPAREGWEDAFRNMARLGDDALLDTVAEPSTDWADREWEW